MTCATGNRRVFGPTPHPTPHVQSKSIERHFDPQLPTNRGPTTPQALEISRIYIYGGFLKRGIHFSHQGSTKMVDVFPFDSLKLGPCFMAQKIGELIPKLKRPLRPIPWYQRLGHFLGQKVGITMDQGYGKCLEGFILFVLFHVYAFLSGSKTYPQAMIPISC